MVAFSEFLSSSATDKIISKFMGGRAGRVILEMKSGNGVLLGPAATVQGEKEVMFPHGMTLKVVSVDTSTGMPVIQLED